MFPNVNELKDAIASNTQSQQELLRLLSELNKNVIKLTKQLESQANKPNTGSQ